MAPRLVTLFLCAVCAFAADPYRAPHAMVVSGESHATDVGVEVLKRSGNAADAAVAMGFALAVTHSGMCGLGGGGHALVRMHDGRTAFLDFREQAPGKASRTMFLDSRGNLSPDSVKGWRAAATPVYVKGLETLHARFGTQPWNRLLAPAVRLARVGYPVSPMQAQAFRASKLLPQDPESRRIFQNNGRFFNPGDTFAQPDLARTLERIARHRAKGFYSGETAARMAAAMERHGGLITAADLGAVTVSERQPLTGRYRGYNVITAAGSSSGGVTLLQMLGILEGSGFEKWPAASPPALHFLAEAMRRCFADRSMSAGDPDFFRVPYSALLDPRHIAELRASIDPGRATPSEKIRPGTASTEGEDTTHYAVVDRAGNAVAMTVTLNGMYGSGVTVPGLGFLLNNNMDNFAANPGKTNQYGLVQGEANAIQPRKRPVSSMTPTMLIRDGRLYLVVGTPGGPTIANSVLQAIVNVVDYRMNAQDAAAAKRIHHQWYPDKLFVEPGFPPEAIAGLEAMGHLVETRPSNNDLNMILVESGGLTAGIDPRREGKASGY